MSRHFASLPRRPALRCLPSLRRSPHVLLFPLAIALVMLAGEHVSAQGWDDDPDEGWAEESAESPPTARSAPMELGGALPTTPWSFRMGAGFISDPNAFLLNFELPYTFDRWVSAGPMVQVGIHDNKSIVAPTANITVRVPDLPGDRFDRFKPNAFVGIGFAVIEKEKRRGDNISAGFLVNFGVGVDYHLSERTAIASRMIFNFLPEETLEEEFFYAWEVLGFKLSF